MNYLMHKEMMREQVEQEGDPQDAGTQS